MMNEPISTVQQEDLLDLELSHDFDDHDVSKAVQPDTNALFPDYQTVDQDDVNQELLGNNSLNNQNNAKISSDNVNININDNNNNKSPSSNDLNASTAKCWNVQYYQPYFDIDTTQELQRLKKSLFPFMSSGEFYDKDLNEKPDLYGPFWITTTLAFLMAAMGNFASYINSNGSDSSLTEWNGDITRISEAATFLYTGIILVPCLLFLIFRTYEETYGIIELISLYGYSLNPYILACILCIAPWNIFDWSVVLTAMCSSIFFLIKNLYKPLSSDKKSRPGLYILIIIIGCQFILALALKLYFFKY